MRSRVSTAVWSHSNFSYSSRDLSNVTPDTISTRPTAIILSHNYDQKVQKTSV